MTGSGRGKEGRGWWDAEQRAEEQLDSGERLVIKEAQRLGPGEKLWRLQAGVPRFAF